MSDSVQPHRRQPTRLPCPWESPGKNAGVGCHFLLQCMKVKSESEVGQSCLTLSGPMDCSLPSSSVHGIFQARVLEWGAVECGAGRGISQNVHSLTVGTSFVILHNFGVLEMKVTCLFRTIVLTQSTTSHLLWQMN